MVDREKSEQALSSVELIQSLKEDRISKLPDLLICQILSHLCTHASIKTSVLSTRWKNLWLSVPNLELFFQDFPDFNTFISFGNRFFDSNRVSLIHKLELGFVDDGIEVELNDDASYIVSWINEAIKRGIQHLDVYGSPEMPMPPRFYTCETLVSLLLYGVTLDDTEFVSLPCLKTMVSGYNMYLNDATFERLVSGSPVLEDLTFYTGGDDPIVLRVHSQSLKKLTLGGSVAGVVLDAPLLFYLRFDGKVSKSFIVNNLDFNDKLDISLSHGSEGIDEAKRSIILSFLPWISRVRELTICADTFKLLCGYARLEPLPQFGYMSCLCVNNLDAKDLKRFPIFLGSCPNLKSLILESIRGSEQLSSEEMERVSFTFVPECLLSSLEFVEFKNPVMRCALGMKLVSYFLENSAILKKLSLHFDHHSRKDEIFEIPRDSTECEVVISEFPWDMLASPLASIRKKQRSGRDIRKNESWSKSKNTLSG